MGDGDWGWDDIGVGDAQIQYLLQMSQENQQQAPAFEPQSRQGTLIESLREQPSFLMEQYNNKLKIENDQKGIRKAGGIYVPPHKLRALQQEMMEADPASEAHQRMMWELLRKSINGIVNKVNIANIQNIVVELFNENILRGRGLLARALIKAQMASPNFTHVYSALIAVINTKVPEIGLLVAKRVLIQFRRSFERNNKIVCVATTRMIAHLINQRVLGEYIALQILLILLTSPTEDSVEIACDFMIEVGQILSEITPAGASAIFERFKSLLHEAEIEQKAQYSIENLFAIRKTGFKEHPGVIPELDLVEGEDQITHQLDLEEEMKGEENLNMFKLDPKYQETEAQWDTVKQEILGEENIARLKEPDAYEPQFDEPPAEEGIQDLTEQDLVNLRKTIYLAIQSTVNFEQCAHKILKMNIAKGYQHELVDMILECCMMQRIYQTFFGLLAERFCIYDNKFKELFERAFLSHYNNIFNQEANKIRNLAHLFGHLFHRKVIDWSILQPIRLAPDTTTAAARMFLKILLKDIGQNLGIENLAKEFQKQELKEYFEGLFPMQNMNDLRFAINYYTTIGLGQLTEEMREVLGLHEEIINERKRKEEEAQAQLLIQEEEEMMRLALEEQTLKEQENKNIKQERREREKRQERRDRDDREERRRDDRYDRYDRDERRDRDDRRDRERGQRREKSRQPRRNREKDDSQPQQERRREKSRSRSEHSSSNQRLRRKQKEKQQREREVEREKQRQNQRQHQKQKEKEREREREKEREKEKERQEREKEKELEKERLREREQKEKEKEREKTKQAEIEKKDKEVKEKEKEKEKPKERKRSRSRDKVQKKTERHRRRSSSSPRRSVQKKNRRRRNATPEQKKAQAKKIASKKRQSSSSSSSSGISSSSSSSSKEVAKPIARKAKQNSDSSSESEVSSSSESSGEVSSSNNRKRVDSSSS